MRRNPSALQARMLRKTRNFALAKFDEVPAHLEQTVVSEWTELVTKPPREDAEIRAAWVADALRAGWNMAGTSQLRGLEAQDAHVADLERAAYPTAVPRAAGEGLVERLVVTYREQLQGDEQPWPEQLVLKMPSFGSFDSYDSLGEQQRYHLAELTFLTESVNSTAHNIVLPNVHWFFLRPPGEKQLRTHWKWAKGTPVFDGQYPYELGEYCCLLEDLYDSSPLVDGAMEREHAEAVVKALASLHAAFWANEETLENPCFKSTQTVKMSDVKDVVAGLLKRAAGTGTKPRLDADTWLCRLQRGLLARNAEGPVVHVMGRHLRWRRGARSGAAADARARQGAAGRLDARAARPLL